MTNARFACDDKFVISAGGSDCRLTNQTHPPIKKSGSFSLGLFQAGATKRTRTFPIFPTSNLGLSQNKGSEKRSKARHKVDRFGSGLATGQPDSLWRQRSGPPLILVDKLEFRRASKLTNGFNCPASRKRVTFDVAPTKKRRADGF